MWYALDSSFLGLGTTDMDQSTDNTPSQKTPDDTGDTEQAIARQLTGELYCIGCGYNLRGLSIRSNCSECGIPVRATILGIVDPKADELVPLIAPRLVALGLNAWSIGAMLAVAMIWVHRILELFRDVFTIGLTPIWVSWIGLGGLVISMFGAFTILRPHRAVPRGEVLRAALGVSFYAPLMYVYSTIYIRHDMLVPSPVFNPGDSIVGRSILRVLMFALVTGIIWGLRPQAVGLAVRSVVVRTGRVDRQSLIAVLVALGIAAFGDLIHIVGAFVPLGFDDVLSIVSLVVIALGSVLFTVGMVNICIDTLRLYPVLVRPGVGLSDIFETNREKSERTGEM